MEKPIEIRVFKVTIASDFEGPFTKRFIARNEDRAIEKAQEHFNLNGKLCSFVVREYYV